MRLGLLSFLGPATANLFDLSNPSASATGKVVENAHLPLASLPCEVEFHPDHLDIAWVEMIGENAIRSINQSSGKQEVFNLKPAAVPSGMEFLADGNLWFSEVVGNSMIRLNPNDGSMTEYPFPFTGLTAVDNLPAGLRVTIDVSGGKDRGAWFVGAGLNMVGRLDIDTFEWSSYPIPTALSLPLIIQPGPANTMVFSEGLGNKVATIDVNTKEINEYEVPTPASMVIGVTTSPEGLIWWTGLASGTFGTVNVTSGEVTEISIAKLRAEGKSTVVSSPGSIGASGLLPLTGPVRVGHDGNIYFSEGTLALGGNRLGQYNPRDGLLVEYELPTSFGSACDLNNQHPGSIYFAEIVGNRLGHLRYM